VLVGIGNVSLAVGILGVTGGIAGIVTREVVVQAYNGSNCPGFGTPVGLQSETCEERNRGNLESAMRTLGLVASIAGGVTATLGAVFVAVGSQPRSRPAAFACAGDPALLTLSCGGRF
jgi:hypothetical protein